MVNIIHILDKYNKPMMTRLLSVGSPTSVEKSFDLPVYYQPSAYDRYVVPPFDVCAIRFENNADYSKVMVVFENFE